MTTTTSKGKGKGSAYPPPPSTKFTDQLASGAIVIPVAVVAAWVGIVYLSQVAHESIPDFPPGAPWPPWPIAGGMIAAGVVVAVCALMVSRARMRKYARRVEVTKFARELSRVARVIDHDSAHGKGHAFRGITPTDLTVSSGLPQGSFGKVAARFADLTRSDVDTIEVTPTRQGTRVRVVEALRYDTPQPARTEDPAQGDPQPVGEALDDWHVDTRKVEQLNQAFKGVLKAGVQIAVHDVHRDKRPARFTMQYPPEHDQTVGDRLGDLKDVLDRKCPPVLGLWKVDWQPTEDRVIFTDTHDPLRKTVPLPHVDKHVDPEVGVPIGITEDGETFTVKLMGGSHVLIAGATGSGKGSPIWGIIRGLAPLDAEGKVRMWVCDPKGGLELGDLKGAVHRYADTNDEIKALVHEAAEFVGPKSRKVRAMTGSRKVTELTPELPLDVIIVDEVAAFAKDSDFAAATAKIMQQGRAAGMTYIAATQDPRQRVLENRHLFTTSIALRVTEAADVNMILGQGARAAGALCDRIPRDMQGTAYIVRDGVAGVTRVRAAYVDDDETRRVVQQLAAGRGLAAPALTPAPDGAPTQDALTDPDPAPEPAGFVPDPPDGDEWVDGADLKALVKAAKDRRDGSCVYARFDGDPDPVRVLAVAASRHYDDAVEVTFCYADEREQVTELQDGQQVEVLDMGHAEFDGS